MRHHAQESGQKKKRNGYSDPFAVPNLLEELKCSRFGSVTEDIKDLIARRSQATNSYFRMHSADLHVEKLIKDDSQVKPLEAPLVLPDVIDLEDDGVADHVVVIDSDVEETGDQRPFNPYREPAAEFLMSDFLVRSVFLHL